VRFSFLRSDPLPYGGPSFSITHMMPRGRASRIPSYEFSLQSSRRSSQNTPFKTNFPATTFYELGFKGVVLDTPALLSTKRGRCVMTKVRVSIGVLAALVIVCGSAAGCGSVSDQTKQEAKEKVGQRAQQASKRPRIRWKLYSILALTGRKRN
jgi:type VI protein secretion system component VasK